MSALGQKRTYAAQQVMSALPLIATAKADFRTKVMSALPPKADIQQPGFGPIADIDCYHLFDDNDLKAPGEYQVKNTM
jgi:hypothetical protein